MRVMPLSNVSNTRCDETFRISNWSHATCSIGSALLGPGRRGMSFRSSSKDSRSPAWDGEGELPWVIVGQVAGTRGTPSNSSIKIAEEGGVQCHGFRHFFRSVIKACSPRISSWIFQLPSLVSALLVVKSKYCSIGWECHDRRRNFYPGGTCKWFLGSNTSVSFQISHSTGTNKGGGWFHLTFSIISMKKQARVVSLMVICGWRHSGREEG